MEQLPIIDLSAVSPLSCDLDTIFEKTETKMLGQEFYNALSTYGFLYITGHGIPDETIETVFKESKDFFHPQNRSIHKKYYRRKGVMLGYVDGLNERDLPENPVDLKQGFDFTLNSPEFEAIPEQQKPALQSLYHNFETLSQFMLRFLGITLGCGTDYFLDGHRKMGDIEESSTSMRIMLYQAVNGEVLEKQSRMSQHTDFGTFTMLIQNEVGGLQVINSIQKIIYI